ncbi:ATP-binding cassette transporter, putative [Pediculus humanus corporis]|uniref:ATP-binding cassette transporter, putative n=1 Tax=Pediculus humanus subsp. corporis TaxID=121224 RepID=E0W1F2_PEDHC|nr:ATP-binding cassette transporter, putative [Pediculus humanus corporis]EEB19458.1 ATP-binding cassette transporter, putative [Pediculus humanus corporis]
MLSNVYVLELSNVEQGTCFQKLMDNVKTGLILKDVSLEVHSGEVLAVLGSKGSGKRALLEVISRRTRGPTRGEILLNGAPMSAALFQNNCGYVTHKCDLIPSLTVMQTLHFASNLTIGSKVTQYMKRSRVRQVLADLALTQVANRKVDGLSNSEYRRLMIGVQLMRDPVLLLLDEPTWDLDPLNTYLVVSILSNHAKKYNRAIILTMEKPRSDVFPFLDRVTYLCLGDVVYTGATQFMLEYFRGIGFPCPELENPLMYYLCLSTVDRRSRERFIESNHQIAALVEKFKVEGGPFRKAVPASQSEAVDPLMAGNQHKVPLSAFGRPGTFQVASTLYMRNLATTFNLSSDGFKNVFLRLLFLPLIFSLLYGLYFNMGNYQRTFLSRNGFVFNVMAAAYFTSIVSTVYTFYQHRTRYYQESQEGLYGGSLFYIVYTVYSLPFSFVSTLASAKIIHLLSDYSSENDWMRLTCALWSAVLLAEHQTMVVMLVVQTRLTAGLTSCTITILTLVLGSGNLKAYSGLAEWLTYLTYCTQTRYLGSFLIHEYLWSGHVDLPFSEKHTCRNKTHHGDADTWLCRFNSGQEYLRERFARDNDVYLQLLTDPNLNLSICLGFSVGLIFLNCVLYLVPLPGFVKAKFRH